MLPEYSKISFSAVFVVFLIWLIVHVAGHAINFKHVKQESPENGGTVVNSTSFGSRIVDADRTLLDGFYLLSIVVVFNNIMLGNQSSLNTFSLIAMFSVIFAGFSHLGGVRLAVKALWILFIISIFALFITAFASPYPWNPATLPPGVNPYPNYPYPNYPYPNYPLTN